MFIDFHTHHPSLGGERVVQDGVDTRGRHPWHLEHLPPHSSPLTSHLSPLTSHLLAIGESGLDRLCATPYAMQLQVFREEVLLSEKLQKPLILHCVRAIDDVLRIRREVHAQQPIIWHGYRGGEKQLQQLLAHDGEGKSGSFYFSFGFRHNKKALCACPPDRLLLETDDELRPIGSLYALVANLREVPLNLLVQQMHHNYHTLFRIPLT